MNTTVSVFPSLNVINKQMIAINVLKSATSNVTLNWERQWYISDMWLIFSDLYRRNQKKSFWLQALLYQVNIYQRNATDIISEFQCVNRMNVESILSHYLSNSLAYSLSVLQETKLYINKVITFSTICPRSIVIN